MSLHILSGTPNNFKIRKPVTKQMNNLLAFNNYITIFGSRIKDNNLPPWIDSEAQNDVANKNSLSHEEREGDYETDIVNFTELIYVIRGGSLGSK